MEGPKNSLLLILQSDGYHESKEEFDWVESTVCESISKIEVCVSPAVKHSAPVEE